MAAESATTVATQIDLTLLEPAGPRHVTVPVRELVMAGWTGRDRAAVEAHIRELAELGVKAPSSIPTFYPVSAARVTTDAGIEVQGRDSTGEVEFVLVAHEDDLWVGLGSDHTDRKVETVSIVRSKEMCAKPFAATVWRLRDVEPHWDQLVLRSFATSAGSAETVYQQGSVAAMRHPRDLLERYGAHHGRAFGNGTVMFCGTFGVIGGFRWADTFRMELEDPVLGRRIDHRYDITGV